MKILMGTKFAGTGKLLAEMLGIPASNVSAYEAPSEILDAFHREKFDLILLGGKLDMGFSGAHVLADLLHRECKVPIIAVSSEPTLNHDMQMVVRNMAARSQPSMEFSATPRISASPSPPLCPLADASRVNENPTKSL